MISHKGKESGKISVVIGSADNTTCFCRENFSGGYHLVHNGAPPKRERVVPGHQAG